MFGPFGAYIAAYLHGYVKAFLVFALSTVALVSYALKNICYSMVTGNLIPALVYTGIQGLAYI